MRLRIVAGPMRNLFRAGLKHGTTSFSSGSFGTPDQCIGQSLSNELLGFIPQVHLIQQHSDESNTMPVSHRSFLSVVPGNHLTEGDTWLGRVAVLCWSSLTKPRLVHCLLQEVHYIEGKCHRRRPAHGRCNLHRSHITPCMLSARRI